MIFFALIGLQTGCAKKPSLEELEKSSQQYVTKFSEQYYALLAQGDSEAACKFILNNRREPSRTTDETDCEEGSSILSRIIDHYGNFLDYEKRGDSSTQSEERDEPFDGSYYAFATTRQYFTVSYEIGTLKEVMSVQVDHDSNPYISMYCFFEDREFDPGISLEGWLDENRTFYCY